MKNITNYPYSGSTLQPSWLDRFLAVLLGGGLIAIASMFLINTAVSVILLGKIFPGVSIMGVDVGGLNRTEAVRLLETRITYPKQGLVAFEDQGKVWTYKPEELGLYLDYAASVNQAYRVGRSGWPWDRLNQRLQVWQDGVEYAPSLILDERVTRQRLNQIASEVNKPVQEANLRLDGVQVVAEPGQIGRMLDVEATITALKSPLTNLLNASIPLPVQEYHPIILDASSQAEAARNILSQPLSIRVSNAPDEKLGPWEFSPETLASMLVIERVLDSGGEKFQVRLDENKMFNIIYPLTPSLSKQPQNARFIFNDDTRQLEVIQPAVVGRELMVDESVQYINEQLQAGNHAINLVFDYKNPEATDDMAAESLGITELVSSETTYFYGSDDGRIQNIVTAASQFHGLLVPPGATFSMVENIGDISLDSGYAEAWIIYGDRTVKGVGGGVCQVSTTLFRTVFFGGFPIVERWPHAYRVYYYELSQSGSVNEDLAGLDATVYAPVVDFKFTNDTENWLLMETYVDVNARSLTWKFYSTKDGRQVDWSTTGLTNTKEPPWPVYEENDDLDKGKIKQVDWAVKGAQVTVTRTVTRNGQVITNDTFQTTYEPWAAVCQYGPGTKDYPPEGNQRDRYSCKVKNN
ncbi:MAG: VanW family protein [Anaerolineales bacterium]